MAEKVGTSKLSRLKNRFVRFFKDVRAELKKVIWPTRQQLINNTGTVLLFCLAIGIIIWVADYALSAIVGWTLTK
jgi:preprotein translocase subunit SecE